MITLTFAPEKQTPRTLRFEEVLPAEYVDPKVRYLYVQKGALGELGYKEGDNLTVTITIAVEGESTPKPKTKPRTRK